MGGGRIGMVFMALAATGTASEVVIRTESEVLNVPLSMLFVAMAGALFGYVLLPAKDAARLASHSGNCWQRRALFCFMTVAPLIFATVAYAFVAAWCVQACVGIVHTITSIRVEQSAVIPATGLAGVGIRPWLPTLLRAVERRAGKVIGGEE